MTTINLISTNNDTNMQVKGVGVRGNADQLKLTDANAFPLRNEGVNLLLWTVKEGDGDGEARRWAGTEMGRHGDGQARRWEGTEMGRWGDGGHGNGRKK